MGFFSGMHGSQDRHYNVQPDLVFQAVMVAIGNSPRFSLNASDPRSLSCTFSTDVSLTSWGANMVASVIPNGGASILRVNVSAKFGFNALWQGSKNSKDVSEFFDEVTQALYQVIPQGQKGSWQAGASV